MAPVWAQANAAAPTTTKKRAALAANPEPIALRIEALFAKRDTFKISSRSSHSYILSYILWNPKVGKKLHGKVNGSKSFASDYRRIQSLHRVARMAKLADARDLKFQRCAFFSRYVFVNNNFIDML